MSYFDYTDWISSLLDPKRVDLDQPGSTLVHTALSELKNVVTVSLERILIKKKKKQWAIFIRPRMLDFKIEIRVAIGIRCSVGLGLKVK